MLIWVVGKEKIGHTWTKSLKIIMSFNLNRNSSLNENNHTYDSTSESNFDKSLRASPSINSGSEPPSYFEAVGIASHLNLVSNGVVNEVCLDIEQIQVNQNQYPPRIISKLFLYLDIIQMVIK